MGAGTPDSSTCIWCLRSVQDAWQHRSPLAQKTTYARRCCGRSNAPVCVKKSHRYILVAGIKLSSCDEHCDSTKQVKLLEVENIMYVFRDSLKLNLDFGYPGKIGHSTAVCLLTRLLTTCNNYVCQ